MATTFAQTLIDLIAAPEVAGIRFRVPYGCTTTTVAPPAGSYRDEHGVTVGAFTLPDGREAATIDSWGSVFSRCEALIPELADAIGYPLITLTDPEGRRTVTSATLSHRQADATWSLARNELKHAGIPFDAIHNAGTRHALPLLEWFPSALIGGWWHSRSMGSVAGKKAQKRYDDLKAATKSDETAEFLAYYSMSPQRSRSARIFVGEVIAAGISERRRHPARVDELFGPVGKLPGGKLKATEVGIGSLPPLADKKAPTDLTFQDLYGTAFLSFSGLRRYGFTEFAAGAGGAVGRSVPDEVARPLIAALSILLYTSLQQHLDLRAGAELTVAEPGMEVTVERHAAPAEPLQIPSIDELTQIVRALGAEAGWQGPRVVTYQDDSPLGKLLTSIDGDTGGSGEDQ